MLINADAKALEWYCAIALSKDPIGLREIIDGEDQHSDNQERFRLPSRLIAKTFLFRIIYGGGARGFAGDSNFGTIGGERFWQSAIDAFYEKYQGVFEWHKRLVEHATQFGSIRIPTGRVYQYNQRELIRNIDYWRPKVLNYCVQGLGAYVMVLIRSILWEKLIEFEQVHGYKPLIVDTVHDSVLLDTEAKWCYNICTMIKDSFDLVPIRFQELFDYDLGMPLRVEITKGMDWKNMEEVEV